MVKLNYSPLQIVSSGNNSLAVLVCDPVLWCELLRILPLLQLHFAFFGFLVHNHHILGGLMLVVVQSSHHSCPLVRLVWVRFLGPCESCMYVCKESLWEDDQLLVVFFPCVVIWAPG